MKKKTESWVNKTHAEIWAEIDAWEKQYRREIQIKIDEQKRNEK